MKRYTQNQRFAEIISGTNIRSAGSVAGCRTKPEAGSQLLAESVQRPLAGTWLGDYWQRLLVMAC